MLRVGYAFTAKKLQRSGIATFAEYARDCGIEFIRVDLETDDPDDHVDLPCLDILVHKITDILWVAEQPDPVESRSARRKYERFQRICRNSKHVMDPVDLVIRPLMQRDRMLEMLAAASESTQGAVNVPPFIRANRGMDLVNNASGVCAPYLVKSVMACSSRAAHQLCLVTSDTHRVPILRLANNNNNTDCIVQQFINHSGIIMKVYVVDGQWHVVPRPSIVDMSSSGDQEDWHFDSQTVPKQFGADTNDPRFNTRPLSADHVDEFVRHHGDAVTQLVEAIRRQFHDQLTFFGVDVIVESGTRQLFAVDLNYFPGFEGFPDFQKHFAACLLRTAGRS